ncbi:unnamed protein product [Fraxinus pennsylvanica]|uniref:Glycosyltransferase n=1 Tax=Fraxinus pennsylvanica TaxID=56036 RepID=A0AAD1ZPA4_9LAMI|nr:unnamed protein product [Fraxinus pennsylvanica]
MGTVDTCHVVAVPYPGRGHINPMMNLCELVSGKSSNILITFVLTEEWLGFIGSDNKSANILFVTIPNVVPSEKVRGSDPRGFALAVWDKMEEPIEQLLDKLQFSPALIIADAFLPWAADVAARRNIPLASLWPMSALVFSVLHHFDLIIQHGHFPINLPVNGKDLIDYIPGLSPIQVADLPLAMRSPEKVPSFLKLITQALKAQYLIMSSIYKLETQVIETLKAIISPPIFTLGPATSYFKVKKSVRSINDFDYLRWLDNQTPTSVLYIALGSYLSISSSQMDEIIAGLYGGGIRFLWVAQGETSRTQDFCRENGLVVPWCDQLSVLCHPSIGGFLSHCGWNSIKEAVLSGVPILTFPILLDQVPNAKMIVEDWQIGWKVKTIFEEENMINRDEIAQLVQRFMNLETRERKQLEKKVREIQQVCDTEFADGGSFQDNLDGFTKSILQYHQH